MDDTFNDSEFKINFMNEIIQSLNFKLKFCGYLTPELLATWPHHADLLNQMGLEGASMGIETLNPASRRKIRKGPDLDGIFRAIERLKSNPSNPVGVQANFIVGLPEESAENLEKTQRWLLENTTLIDQVSWQALEILKPVPRLYLSEIDKDPAKYGYKITGVLEGGSKLNWQNSFFNYSSARALVEKYRADHNRIARLGGWAGHQLRSFKNINYDQLMKDRSERYHLEGRPLGPTRLEAVREYFLSLGLGSPRNGPRPDMPTY